MMQRSLFASLLIAGGLAACGISGGPAFAQRDPKGQEGVETALAASPEAQPYPALPTNGIRMARQWQLAADIAYAHGRWEEAFHFYEKIALTFPGTRHGRFAAERMERIAAQLASPQRPPDSEDADSWIAELWSFLTWP